MYLLARNGAAVNKSKDKKAGSSPAFVGRLRSSLFVRYPGGQRPAAAQAGQVGMLTSRRIRAKRMLSDSPRILSLFWEYLNIAATIVGYPT